MIYRGIKIEKTEDKIVIYNTRLTGDFYKEISQQEYDVFYRYGFLFGVYTICIQNYRVILNKLQVKIRNEVGNRNNQRHYNALKQYRNTIMNKFTDTLKLIQDENRRQLQD